MFIQDIYLGLDGKQRVIVLGAAGISGLFLLCGVLWLFSGGRTESKLTDQERIAITSGETAARLITVGGMTKGSITTFGAP